MDRPQELTKMLFQHFQDKQNRSYPLLLTEEQIARELNNLVENDNADYLWATTDGELTEFCGWIVDPDAHYVQTQILASFDDDYGFISRTLEYLIDRYPDCTIAVGVEADNDLLVDALGEKNFALDDSSYAMSLKPMGARGEIHDDIRRVSAAEWGDYRELHEQAFGDYYWTHAKIQEDFKNWIVYSKKAGESIAAYCFIGRNPKMSAGEIYGIYGADVNDRIALVEHAAGTLQDLKILYYFTDDPDEMKACKELGFDVHGHYQLWEREPSQKTEATR